MTATPLEEQNSAADMIRALHKSAKWILLAGAIGTAAGLLTSVIVPPRWTAKLTIQVGQVTVANARGTPTKLPIENQMTAAERINQPNFRSDVLKALGLPAQETGNKQADLVFDSLKASSDRNTDLVTVQATDYSREGALAVLDTTFKSVSATHRQLFDQSMEQAQRELARTQDSLTAAEAEYRSATQALKASYASNANTTSSAREVLISTTASLLRSQVSDLQQQVNALRDALTPLQSYPTRVMATAYVPEKPSTPSRTVWMLGGAVLGLIIGAVLALLRDTLKND